MCRNIGFISVYHKVGDSELIYELSQQISSLGARVCVIDLHFGMNCVSNYFNKSDSVDIKEYIVGRSGTYSVLNQVDPNLFYVKSNSFSFDYLSHFSLIEFFVEEISQRFDYILIDLNFGICKSGVFLKLLNEIYVFCTDENLEIRNTAKLLMCLKAYSNILSHKLIITNARIFSAKKKKCFSFFEVEKILKTEIEIIVPKFLNLNKKILKTKKKILIKNMANKIVFQHEDNGDRLKNFYGIFNRLRYYKYE